MATIFDPYIAYLISAQQSFVTIVGQSVWDMIIYSIGIAAYAILIWHFYKYVSRRDVFRWDTQKYETSGMASRVLQWFLYVVKYLIAYPILVFVWFGFFATMVFMLGSLDDFQALLVAFSMVTAIRITAYYKGDISNDLGKLLPLAMLGVFILQPSFLQLGGIEERFFNLGLFAEDILKFTAVAVALEWILRIGWSVKRAIMPPKEEGEKKNHERFGR